MPELCLLLHRKKGVFVAADANALCYGDRDIDDGGTKFDTNAVQYSAMIT